jgi:iron complex outermembrane recepter protein
MPRDRKPIPSVLTPVALVAGLLLGAPGGALAQPVPDPAPSTPPPAVPSPAAGAQGQDPQRIEVTARRRLESQLEVPASVSAISGETLRATGATGMEDMIALVPNANMTENPRGFDTYVSIRGMRQADVGAEPNFGMYRNGIFAGGHRINLGSQIDVERVEIVRGPQGGLYGRNAVGGAVNVIYRMPKPGEDTGGYVALGLENKATRVEGAATVGLGERAAMRGAAWSTEQRKGDYYNVTLGEEIDRAKDRGLRLSLAAAPGAGLDAMLTLEASKADTPALRTYAPRGVANGPVARSAPETRRTVQQDTASRNDVEQQYLAGRLGWTMGGGTLSLLASVRDYQLVAVQDQDQTALPLNSGPLALRQVLRRQEDIQQRYLELLWESDATQALSWRGGVSYFDEDFGIGQTVSTDLDTALLGFINVPNVGVIGGSANLPQAGSATSVKSWSGFADVRYAFTPEVAATVTVRRSVDRQTLRWRQGIDPSSHPIGVLLFSSVVPDFELNARDTYSFTSPSAGLEFKLAEGTHGYVQYGTGYRPGGYNTSVTNPDFIPYGQESARNLEAGLKTQFLEGRGALNLSVFRMDQKDLVVQQDDPGDTQFGFTYLANVGKARTTGFELELLGTLSSAWRTSFSVGHLRARYTEGSINAGTPDAVDVTGRDLQGVRPWTVNLRADYRGTLAGRELTAGVSVRHETGGAIGDLSDIDLADYTRLDLYVGLRFAPRTQLNVFVRNALDEQIEVFRFVNGAVGTTQGRRFGIQLTQRF